MSRTANRPNQWKSGPIIIYIYIYTYIYEFMCFFVLGGEAVWMMISYQPKRSSAWPPQPRHPLSEPFESEPPTHEPVAQRWAAG